MSKDRPALSATELLRSFCNDV